MKKRMTAFLCALALILTMIPASAPVAEAATPSDTLYVGYGLQNITPTMSVPLAGYGDTHKRMSEYNANDIKNSHLLDDNGDGVVDENDGIYAACVAVKDSDGEILIFFGLDLISAVSISTARAEIVKTLAQQGVTVKENNISLTVSHTHAAPDMGSTNSAIALYRDTIMIPGIVKAAQQAVADFKPVTDISKVTVKTENMNFIRHYEHSNSSDFSTIIGYSGDNYSTGSKGTYTRPVREADPNIYMLKFERADGQPVVMANWTAHPKCNSTGETAWGKINRLKVTSDYVGTFRGDLARAGYLAAFFQGTAGDTNTFSKLKTFNSRYADPTNPATKQYVSGPNKNENYNGGTVSGTCQTGVAYGRVLADYALGGLRSSVSTSNVKVESLQGGKIKAQQRMFSATVDRGNPEAYEALMQTMPNSTQTYYTYLYNNFSTGHELARKYDIKSKYHVSAIKRRMELAFDGYQLELDTYQIGDDISFATAPNEIFTSYFMDMKNQGTFVFGYSNGSQGYLPDVDGIEKHLCYEANTTNFVVGTGEALAKTLKEMMMTPEELGLSSTCHLCGAKNVQWEILNGTSDKGTYSEWIDITKVTGGHYYMIHDLYGGQKVDGVTTQTYQKSIYGNVCLDMRGHTIGAVSSPTGRTLYVANGANLRIANGTLLGRGLGATASNKNGGVVLVANGATMTAQNMTIHREVKENKTAVNGGAIYVDGTLNLLDSKVTNGVATSQGGGVYVTARGKLNVGGSTAVVGNTEENGTANNIYLEKASTAGSNFQILNDFTGSVGVTLPNNAENTVFGTCPDPYTSGGYIDLDESDSFAGCHAGKLTIGGACPYCGEENVTWKEFPASGSGDVLNIPAGHYYLADDRTGTSNFRRQIQGDVCLNMNGHTFATESAVTGNAFYVNPGYTFNVFGGGVIQGQGYGGTSTAPGLYRGGVIRVDTNAKANLYGTTVQRKINGNQIAKWGGVIYTAGELNLYGATVKGGAATINGDGIYVETTGSLTLAGNTTVEKNIYVDTTGDTAGSRLSVAEGFAGAAIVELPTYTDSLIFGTAGSYTGTVKLAAENVQYVVDGGNMTIYVPSNVCQIVSADGSVIATYNSVEAALADYTYNADEPSYIQLLKDIRTAATIDKAVYLDTNGFDITVAVTNNGALYGMENATNDYAVGTDDLGKVTVQSGSVLNATDITLGGVRYRYLPLEQSEGVFAYHRFDINTKKGLRPYNEEYGVALYYQPHFMTDEVVAATLNDANQEATFGVSITIAKAGAEELLINMEDYNLTFNQDVCSGKYRAAVPELIPSNSELTAGAKTLATHDLSSYGVTGRAYIMLRTSAGQSYFIYDDADATISLRDAILKVDNDAVYRNLSQAQKNALNTMYKYYTTAIDSWGSNLLNNIGNIKIDISDWFG